MDRFHSVIYCRYSSEKHESPLYVDFQESICDNYISLNLMRTVAVYREEANEDKPMNRPVFKEMLAYCERNQDFIEFLILANETVFSCKRHEYAKLKKTLKEWNIRIETVFRERNCMFSDLIDSGIQAVIKAYEDAGDSKSELRTWEKSWPWNLRENGGEVDKRF